MFVSIRDEILLQTGFNSIHEGLTYYGLEGVEMRVQRDNTVHALTPTPEKPRLSLDRDEDIDTLHRQAHGSGLRVSAFLVGNDFNAPDREREIAWIITAVEAARKVGAPAVRIDAIMSGQSQLPLDQRVDIVARGIRDVLDRTRETHVDLGIENHGAQGNDPAFLDSLLQKVGSPRLGLTMDVGNFYWSGKPLSCVYEILHHFAPKAKHTHIKNIRYPEDRREVDRPLGWEYDKYVCPIAEGDLDLNRVVGYLAAARYSRDLCIEDESLGHYDESARRDHIKSAIAALNAAIEASR